MTWSARYRPRPPLNSGPRTDTGNGPLVLLIHPAGADPTTWGRFHDLPGKAHRVVTCDRRGCNATATGSKVVLPQARPYPKALPFLADSGYRAPEKASSCR